MFLYGCRHYIVDASNPISIKDQGARDAEFSPLAARRGAVNYAMFAGDASAATRQECAGQCQVCGNDAVCGTIYENCINNCMRGASQQAPPPLPDVWGAIAVSASTLDYGTSWNFKSEKDAGTRAIQECQKAAGAKDCKVVVTVADVCVALSISKPDKIFAIGGPTGAVNYASGNATLHCQRAGGKSCAITTSFCADGIRHQTKTTSTPVPFGRR